MSEDARRLAPPGFLRPVAEAVLLFLTVLAPWPFASVEGPWEALLISGVALLTVLWILNSLETRQLVIRPDLVSLIFLGFIALTIVQLLPMPQSVVSIASTTRVKLHRELVPDTNESLPGESMIDGASVSSAIPLTSDAFLTKTFLVRITALFLLYLVVRNWLGTRDTFRRLAWATAANAFALALLALSQFFSSRDNVIFWHVETTGAVFGPFVCRNHYPDFILFGLGMGIALMVARRESKKSKSRGIEYSTSLLTKISDSPDRFALGLGLLLILISIPFSLSRGGMLSTLAAGTAIAGIIYSFRGTIRGELAIAAFAGVLALLLGGWFGWASVGDRLSTLGSGTASQGRTELWQSIIRVVPSYLALGGGNGALVRFEPVGRTDVASTNYAVDYAHNEYLEALAEGGLARLVLTLALVVVIVRTGLRSYRRLADRSTGPLVLGAFFGLIGLMIHSILDFGIHMPAIAFLAVTMLAFLSNAATDPAYIPSRKGASSPGPSPDPGKRILTWPSMIVALSLFGAASLAVVWFATARGEAYALKIRARDAARFNVPKQSEIRVDALSAAVALTPNDGEAWMLLAQARFERVREQRTTTVMALVGGTPSVTLPQEVFDVESGPDLADGLAAARQARNLSPLQPQPHIFLAIHQAGFAKSEPARVHLDRASRCAPTDPQLFALRGREALRRGDLKTAFSDWQKAMTMNSFQVQPILRYAQRLLTPQQILTELLPAEPLAIWLALEQIYPSWTTPDPTLRKPYLDRIASLATRGDWPTRSWEAIAYAAVELNKPDDAQQAWLLALKKDPDAKDTRFRFALWLEADERYDLAEEQLVWLREHPPTEKSITQRIDAVRHARRLQQIIEGR